MRTSIPRMSNLSVHSVVPESSEKDRSCRSTSSGARGYLFAALCLGAAFALRIGFDSLWGNRLPYVWFFLANLAVARFSGVGPQIASLLAGFVLGDWFFVEPRHSFVIQAHTDQINAGIYLFVGSLIVFCAALTRRAAAENLAAQKRIAGILECTSDAVCTLDRDWNVIYLNRVGAEITRRRPERVLGRNYWEIWPECVGTRFEQEYRCAMERRQIVRFEECYPGSQNWIEAHACPYGEGIAIFFRDVSNRKRAEESRARLAAIVESSDDAIIGTTLDGLITTWNAAAETLYGSPGQSVVGQAFATLFPTGDKDEITPMLQKVGQGERVSHFETRQRAKSEAMVDVSLTISPVKTPDGQIVSISITARNVSERKRQETERERLIKQLQAALAEVKNLTGLLPICAHCKNIRDDKGSWNAIEKYIRDRSEADFTHSICPDCSRQLYPDFHMSSTTCA